MPQRTRAIQLDGDKVLHDGNGRSGALSEPGKQSTKSSHDECTWNSKVENSSWSSCRGYHFE